MFMLHIRLKRNIILLALWHGVACQGMEKLLATHPVFWEEGDAALCSPPSPQNRVGLAYDSPVVGVKS